jgi:hydrogenase expression/formation protein HypD
LKYVDEYRDGGEARRYAEALSKTLTRPWTVMEVCGGQTHAIVRFGLEELLPPGLDLVHGPGCPVCVTPMEIVDRAVELARRPGLIFCSFGDMLRVPGTRGALFDAKADGGDVRMVYSPLDAVEIARREPGREVVFFAVGFETTAPAHALAVKRAAELGLGNFSLLVSHVRVPPAMEAILSARGNRVQGFLAAGHVCTVMGFTEYEPIAARHRVPIVVTGFEPLDLLQGLLMCVKQLEEGRAEVENQYSRSVRQEGNEAARALLREVFEIVPRRWRGMGEIPASGLALRETYAAFDAERRFGAAAAREEIPNECRSGEVLQGRLKPRDCPAFGTRCTPESPLGAPMVSSEGACAAYYRYRGAEGRA